LNKEGLVFLKPFFFAENLSQTDMFLNSSCVEITDGKSMSSCPVSFGHASPELACKFYSSDQYRSYSDLKTKKLLLKDMVITFMNLINMCSARDCATE